MLDTNELLNEVSHYYKLPAPFNGKLEYIDEYSSKWTLEVDEESDIISLYSVLRVEERPDDIFPLLMALNGAYELTLGAVLSYCLETDVFHLRFSAPLKWNDFVTVKNIIDNLIEVKHTVERELRVI